MDGGEIQINGSWVLVEIRDRYPEGSRGGQRRFTLVLQDPEPNTFVDRTEAIIESDVPLDFDEIVPVDNSTDEQGTTADNPQSLIGRENQNGWKDKYINNPSIQSITHTPEEIVGIDQQLSELAPELGLTFEQIAIQVGGRVDLTQIDVIKVVRDVLLSRNQTVTKPASYIATSLVRTPARWLKNNPSEKPFVPELKTANTRLSSPQQQKMLCGQGVHDWGPIVWGEQARSSCVLCGTRRSQVEPDYDADVALISADGQVI